MKNKMRVFGIALTSLLVLGSCTKDNAIDSPTATTRDFTPIKLKISLEADRLSSNSSKPRALDYKLTNTKDGKIAQPKLDYSTGKNTNFKSIALFYAPNGATGKKFFSAELTWQRRDDQEKDPDTGSSTTKVRYVCETEIDGIANAAGVDAAALKGQTWYLANIVGATLDSQTKKIIVDPYANGVADGWGIQNIGDVKINTPMTSQWIPVQFKERTSGSGLWVTSDVRSQFEPLGILLRIDIASEATLHNFILQGVSIYSNYLSGAGAFSFDEASLQSPDVLNAVRGAGKLSLTPQNSSTGIKPKFTLSSPVTLSPGADLVADNNQVLLVWGMHKKLDGATLKRYVSVEVDADVERVDGKKVYHSADKRADYIPEDQRVSLFRQKPILSFTFGKEKELIASGQTGFARATISDADFNKLFNLERLVFENVKTDNGSYTFRSNHPYVNWHTDKSEFWLDTPHQYSPGGQRRVLSTFKPTNDRNDPYFKEHKFPSITSTATYYLPSKEQIQSFLPVDPSTGEFVMPSSGKILDITTKVQEQDLNLRHGEAKNAKVDAQFRFKGGDPAQIKLYTEGGKIPFISDRANPLDHIKAGHHILNFNPTSRVGYALAFLRAGDPTSLVAYRYSWNVSPPTSRYINGLTSNPATRFSWVQDRAITSYLMISMIPLGKKTPIKNLNDIDMVANEDFWIPLAQNGELITRILLATGHKRGLHPLGSATQTSDRNHRSANIGSYLLTQDYEGTPDGGSYYFVIDSTGWSLRKFEATESRTRGGASTAVSNQTSMMIHPFVGVNPN